MPINHYFLLLVSYLLLPIAYASNVPPACSGDNTMIALIDRPSVAYSPCTVPDKTLFVESGYAYQLLTPSGYAHNIPQTELRFGLPHNTEIDVFPPNYFEQNQPPEKGFGSTLIGMKHALFFNEHQLLTLQGYISPPSGNQYFGTSTVSYLLNAIYNYNFDSGIGVSTTLGFASNSSSRASPTNNFYTFNPLIDIGWSFTDNLGGYLEFYGQSKTALNQGWGVSVDGGLILLAAKNITLDLSCGQRITGYLDGVDHYFEAGFVVALNL